jgi:hypothetical protein
MILLLLAALLTGPALTQTPNSSCYVVDREMAQHRPCKPEETR